jgi:hypothetical protein
MFQCHLSYFVLVLPSGKTWVPTKFSCLDIFLNSSISQAYRIILNVIILMTLRADTRISHQLHPRSVQTIQKVSFQMSVGVIHALAYTLYSNTK